MSTTTDTDQTVGLTDEQIERFEKGLVIKGEEVGEGELRYRDSSGDLVHPKNAGFDWEALKAHYGIADEGSKKNEVTDGGEETE